MHLARRQTLFWLQPVMLGGLALAAGCGGDREPYRPAVHKVYLHGVKQISAGDVKKKISIQQSSWFPLAPKKRLPHPQAADFDRERITTYYQTRGYYQTKVESAEVKPYKIDPSRDPNSPEYQKSVDVHFTIDEGPPTKIASVLIEGIENGTSRADYEYVMKKITVRPGQLAEHEPYLEAKEIVVQRLRQRGYAFAHITSSALEINREDQTAVIRILLDPGKKQRLGQVLVRGNTHVDADSIKRHVGLDVGESFKQSRMDEAQGRLFSTGLFTTVRVEPVTTLDEQVADVVITVAEGKRHELRAGVGVGIEPLRNEVHAEFIYTRRRFLGGLRQLQLQVRPGYAAMPAVWADPIRRHGPILETKAEFTQPDIFGAGSALTLMLGYDLGIQYAYQYHGPSLRLGVNKYFWQDRISLAASYNFQFLDFFYAEAGLDQGSTGGTSSAVLFGFIDPYRLGYFQEQIGLDFRNRKIDARRGAYFLLTAEQGGVYAGGAFSYQKLQPEARGYLSLGERVTIAARVQYGHIFTQGDTGSPITQRFYLGGPNSHRGFTYNRLSYQMCSGAYVPPGVNGQPAGPPTPLLIPCENPNIGKLNDIQRLPTGGDTMLLGQLELRVGLFKPAGQWLTLAGFVDAGDVTAPPGLCETAGCGKDITASPELALSRLHVAVGGGLRYHTVIGTIRFDLGVRLNRLAPVENGVENPDPNQRIAYHISIGESF